MHDIESRQGKVTKHDTVTRLEPKDEITEKLMRLETEDEITEKLNDCGKRPQQSPDGLHTFGGCGGSGLQVNFNNGQSGKYHFGGLYEYEKLLSLDEHEPTAEEEVFYGW